MFSVSSNSLFKPIKMTINFNLITECSKYSVYEKKKSPTNSLINNTSKPIAINPKTPTE